MVESWETDLQPDLPTVNADAHRLIQVLTNLLANAIYYTPPGGLIQIITRRQVDDDKPWVTLSVRDNGPGISAEEQATVFGRFFRGAAGRASQRPFDRPGISHLPGDCADSWWQADPGEQRWAWKHLHFLAARPGTG